MPTHALSSCYYQIKWGCGSEENLARGCDHSLSLQELKEQYKEYTEIASL